MSTWGKAKWKGKQRARDNGQGGSDGIVLSLDIVSTGSYDIAYTIPVIIGADHQNLTLQVDTGSSDLWIASTSCGNCQSANGLYNPSQATQTGATFTIQYLMGNVSGPIVWDLVQLGGYDITSQALAAADNVIDEPLSAFDGILGLAPPLDSVIAQAIPPVTGNNPDGAAFASNLFSITPASSAPSAQFISLTLSRPGSDTIPSLLGIGRHPTEVISDPKQIQYSTVVSEQQGIMYWKTVVMAITVYTSDQVKPIAIGLSNRGRGNPTAVIDTGVPVILMTSTVANGIYGAIGIQPAADGTYYVPCNVPLNLTITLDDRSEIPIHPLDLTVEPPSTSGSGYCIGLIQAADQLNNPSYDIGDMILGVPFIRNVYTVMAYKVPDENGNFPPSSNGGPIQPCLGLLGLTNATIALQEFEAVRVYNQPLGPTHTTPSSTSDRKLTVGIEVLIGLFSFFALCFFLFGLRWFLMRRKWGRNTAVVPGEFSGAQKGVYQLAPRHSLSHGDQPSEETLRTLRYEHYMEKERERIDSGNTFSSLPTQVGSDDAEEFGSPAGEFDQTWDPATGLDWGDGTFVGENGVRESQKLHLFSEHDPKTIPFPINPPSSKMDENDKEPSHLRSLSVSMPLLAHIAEDSGYVDDEIGEFGEANTSMAGVGTAARGSRIDLGLGHASMGSKGSLSSIVGAGAGAGAGAGSPRSRFRQWSSSRPPSIPTRIPEAEE